MSTHRASQHVKNFFHSLTLEKQEWKIHSNFSAPVNVAWVQPFHSFYIAVSRTHTRDKALALFTFFVFVTIQLFRRENQQQQQQQKYIFI